MENIEDKLENFRLRKRRQQKIIQIQRSVKSFFMFGIKDKEQSAKQTTLIIHDSEAEEHLNRSSRSDETDKGVNNEVSSAEGNLSDRASNENLFLQYIRRIVYLAFWITLYIIAIELQFGIVFLMFSALAGIYLNTRTAPKNYNEISAYSVFNKNCESIDGTLKAEQFEREIGIR